MLCFFDISKLDIGPLWKISVEIMGSIDRPPAYDELFPVTEREHTLTPMTKLPPKYLDDLSSPPPNHATYFNRTASWADGTGFYRGEMDYKGRRSGQGTMIWTQSEVGDIKDAKQAYSGQWTRDLMSGSGEMWWAATGTVYTGNWVGGLMHGQGRINFGENTSQPGHIYSGQFR